MGQDHRPPFVGTMPAEAIRRNPDIRRLILFPIFAESKRKY
jgi:hypothetical protein